METPLNEAGVAVAAEIRRAFADIPRVARKSLVYEGSWETDDLLRNLAKVLDIPTDQFIEWHADSLPVFTPEGLRHVLPYYMLYSLRQPRSEAAERLIFHLAPAETDDDYWRPRLAAFSRTQRHAICAFVNFMALEPSGEHYQSHFARSRVVWGCSEQVDEINQRGENRSTD
jgi:hypothetical protein